MSKFDFEINIVRTQMPTNDKRHAVSAPTSSPPTSTANDASSAHE
jgi:hypothetical protein